MRTSRSVGTALLVVVCAAAAIALATCGRHDDPRTTLDRFFSTTVRQNYAATYDCYDAAYHAKVTREEFVKHRAEASPLQNWRVVSLDERGDRASAKVELTFGPWARAGRTTPISSTVEENLVRENGRWRIRVW